MKILHVATFSIGANGPTSVLTAILKRLSSRENEIGVLSTLTYDNEKEEFLKRMRVKYYYKDSSLPFNRKSLMKCVPDIKTYDVVHLHGIFNFDNYNVARTLKYLGIPYVITVHGNLMKKALKHSGIKKALYINLFAKSMITQASKVHALANEEKIDIKSLVENINIDVVPNGIELSELEQIDLNKPNKLYDRFKILFIGRLDVYHKGIDILFDSISQLESELGDRLQIHIVGPYNSKVDEKYIANRINTNNYLKKVVRLEGPKYSNEKNKFLREADLFIHTSRYEGMPVAVLEAMGFGVPCLVTQETNMKDIIADSNGGFITTLDSEEIAKTIIDVVNNYSAMLPQIGSNAQEWCYKYLNWDLISEKYLQMYNSIKQ